MLFYFHVGSVSNLRSSRSIQQESRFRMDDYVIVPEGWSRSVSSGRIVYASPEPYSVRMYSRSELAGYQKKGRFLDVVEDQFVFSRKRKKKDDVVMKKKMSSFNTGVAVCGGESVTVQPQHVCDSTGLSSSKPMVDKEEDPRIRKLKKEQCKLAEAVSKLTIDPGKKVDNKSALESAAKRLNEARLRKSEEDSQKIDDIKHMIENCKSEDDIFKVLWSNPQFQSRFSSLFTSKLLEQLMSLESHSSNPLKSFPVDINSNVYADIVNFALDNASDVILLLLNLTKMHEKPISAKDVVELAFSFSTLAESTSSKNNSLKKIKSICLKSSGLTNAGLDALASVGLAESSRSFRNDRDLLASISEEIVKQYAKNHTAQFCFDNLDININKTPHHLTLNFLEFEPTGASEFDTKSKPFEEMLDFFALDSVLIQSDQEMFEHFQFVTSLTLT